MSLRRPAKFNMREKFKSSVRYQNGLSRIEDSLDIVSFMRQQMSELVVRRLLFTKFERYMINR